MNLPNRLTVGRIAIVPAFAVSLVNYHPQGPAWPRYMALALFAAGAVTDALDGAIARRRRQRTQLGTFLDPLADKALLGVAFVLLAAKRLAPWWLAVLVVVRDVIIIAGAWFLREFVGAAVVRPRLLGKLTTCVQMITVIWLLMGLGVSWLWWWFAAAATVASFGDYLFYAMRKFENSL